ncbi:MULTISPECIES: hypothetical protein [Vibrio harveyi group]|uniref:hypothetical protein n=1 Tax=Vibrio harveyi group TaxID=717610 RepID=UPI000A68D40D|nr:hypothetical protein [Vibrio diabolicus]MCS0311742.1 hypothetical protein [Vibrio diabolicus]
MNNIDIEAVKSNLSIYARDMLSDRRNFMVFLLLSSADEQCILSEHLLTPDNFLSIIDNYGSVYAYASDSLNNSTGSPNRLIPELLNIFKEYVGDVPSSVRKNLFI